MDLIGELSKQGLAYLLLAISLLAIVYLFKLVQSLQEKRIQDMRDSRDAIMDPLKNLQRSMDFMTTILNKKSSK